MSAKEVKVTVDENLVFFACSTKQKPVVADPNSCDQTFCKVQLLVGQQLEISPLHQYLI